MPRIARIAAIVLIASRAAWADPPPTPEQAKFFESEVRPLLATRCWSCHGPEKQKANLRLDSREALLQGGDGGPVLEPGSPDESLMVQAIRHDGLEMPPSGKLPDKEIEALVRWVAIGAPWPESGEPKADAGASPKAGRQGITEEDRRWWAFLPVERAEPPVSSGDEWSRTPIDRFLYAKLDAEGIGPAPEADRRTLIRRATFDLWGLPPTPEEVEAFANDPAPDAYEKLIDRLLAGDAYGERQARFWLDLVRYAESDGYRADAYRPEAWRYRDYVVRAFKRDLPYDRFLAEQIAGDELAPGDPSMRVATSFLRLWPYEYNQRDVKGQWATILNDITDVTGDAILGMGIGCARCHNHKFDPILQEDYYRIQAFFTPIQPRDDLPLVGAEEWEAYLRKKADWERMTEQVRGDLDVLERPYRADATKDAYDKFQPDIKALLDKPESALAPAERQLRALASRQIVEEFLSAPEKLIKGGLDKALRGALVAQLAEDDAHRPAPPPMAMTVTDVGPVSPPTVIPGDRKARDIPPGPLSVIDPRPSTIVPPVTGASTGRRSALVRWLTDPGNPLTARVMVNRVWQQHFGRGLVGTASDFGRLGERPSHPELLDWLADEFRAQGWSFKALHRLILTSSAYRQSALRSDPGAETARLRDPEDRWLWRAPIRRLDAEQVRDAFLALGGELDRSPGGPASEPSGTRRSIYAKLRRNARDPLLEAFDAADPFASVALRNVTTSPTQALLLLNSPWTLKRSESFAARVAREGGADDAGRAGLAYRLAFGREPSADELAKAAAFLERQRGLAGSEPALADFCHALLNANEFLYVD